MGAKTSGILDELNWRGLIAQSTDIDAIAAAAAQPPITVYAGFDPTAPSLHAGNLVPLLALQRFQRAGHRPIVLAGGATGLIGDPRDSGERTMNTADTVAQWSERIRGQLERFVDFDAPGSGNSSNAAIIENNLSWTQPLGAIEFLRDVGKHFSVNVMLDRDTIRRRLDRYEREWQHVHPRLTGDDLRKLGLPPGRIYRAVLDRLRAALLDGMIATRAEEEALALQVIQAVRT